MDNDLRGDSNPLRVFVGFKGKQLILVLARWRWEGSSKANRAMTVANRSIIAYTISWILILSMVAHWYAFILVLVVVWVRRRFARDSTRQFVSLQCWLFEEVKKNRNCKIETKAWHGRLRSNRLLVVAEPGEKLSTNTVLRTVATVASAIPIPAIQSAAELSGSIISYPGS